ncbi:MAG TPA: DUF748 domain-containing protein [bacterium]|nr:DUF748 domain-containing protein [bacterium]
MNVRRIVYCVIAFPLALHVSVYLLSMAYAKPYFEGYLCTLFRSSVTIADARISLLTQSIHFSQPRITIEWDNRQDTFFQAQKVKISFDILPLLRKRLIIKNIACIAPVVSVERSRAGTFNIQGFFDRFRNIRKNADGTVQDGFETTQGLQARHGGALQTYLQKGYIKEGTVIFTDYNYSTSPLLAFRDVKFAAVFTYDFKKAELDAIKIKLNTTIQSDQPSAAKIDGEIDPTPDYVGSTFRLNVFIENFDLMPIWPYLERNLPLTITAGRMSVESHLNCVGGTFENSKQTVGLKALSIGAWKEDFAGAGSMGMSNKLLIDYIEKNCQALAFDFYISGSLKDLKVTPGEMMLKVIGDTLLPKAPSGGGSSPQASGT